MELKPNIERLERALEIMQGLDEVQVDLGMIFDDLVDMGGPCGSCGCVIGWCATDKKGFPGLHFDSGANASMTPLEWDGVAYPSFDYEKVGAKVFGISLRDASDLFCCSSEGRFDNDLFPTQFGGEEPDPSDKEVAIARLRFAIDTYKTGVLELPARVGA